MQINLYKQIKLLVTKGLSISPLYFMELVSSDGYFVLYFPILIRSFQIDLQIQNSKLTLKQNAYNITCS